MFVEVRRQKMVVLERINEGTEPEEAHSDEALGEKDQLSAGARRNPDNEFPICFKNSQPKSGYLGKKRWLCRVPTQIPHTYLTTALISQLEFVMEAFFGV